MSFSKYKLLPGTGCFAQTWLSPTSPNDNLLATLRATGMLMSGSVNEERLLLGALNTQETCCFLAIVGENPSVSVVHHLGNYATFLGAPDPMEGRVLAFLGDCSDANALPMVVKAPAVNTCQALFGRQLVQNIPEAGQLDAFYEGQHQTGLIPPSHLRQRQVDPSVKLEENSNHSSSFMPKLMLVPKEWASYFMKDDGSNLPPYEAFRIAQRLVERDLVQPSQKKLATPLLQWLAAACVSMSDDPMDVCTSCVSTNWDIMFSVPPGVKAWAKQRVPSQVSHDSTEEEEEGEIESIAPSSVERPPKEPKVEIETFIPDNVVLQTAPVLSSEVTKPTALSSENQRRSVSFTRDTTSKTVAPPVLRKVFATVKLRHLISDEKDFIFYSQFMVDKFRCGFRFVQDQPVSDGWRLVVETDRVSNMLAILLTFYDQAKIGLDQLPIEICIMKQQRMLTEDLATFVSRSKALQDIQSRRSCKVLFPGMQRSGVSFLACHFGLEKTPSDTFVVICRDLIQLLLATYEVAEPLSRAQNKRSYETVSPSKDLSRETSCSSLERPNKIGRFVFPEKRINEVRTSLDCSHLSLREFACLTSALLARKGALRECLANKTGCRIFVRDDTLRAVFITGRNPESMRSGTNTVKMELLSILERNDPNSILPRS